MSDVEILAALAAMIERSQAAATRAVPVGIQAIRDEAMLSLSLEDRKNVLDLAARLATGR